MQEHRARTWNELEEIIQKIKKCTIQESSSQLLFRGHANASWHLDTTLERHTEGQSIQRTEYKYNLSEYYKKAYLYSNEIETYLGQKQFLPQKSPNDATEEAHKHDWIEKLPELDYLA